MSQWSPNPASQSFGHFFLRPDQLENLSSQKVHGSTQVDAGVIPMTRAHQDRNAAVYVADLEPTAKGWADFGGEHGRVYRNQPAAITWGR